MQQNYINFFHQNDIMDRDIPVFNKPIMQKIYKNNQEIHRNRLKNIMNAQNNYIFNKRYTLSQEKALLLEETKQQQIQRNNNILFNKMANIIKRTNSYNRSVPPNRANYSAIRPSINSQFNQINKQNKFLHSRLQQQRASISNKKLAQQRKKNLTFLKILRKKPNIEKLKCKTTKRNSQSQEKRQSQQSNYFDQQIELQSIRKNISTHYQNNHHVSKAFKISNRRLKSQNDQHTFIQKNSQVNQQNHEIRLNEVFCKISGRLMTLRFIRLDNSYQLEAVYTPKGKQPITYKIQFQQEVGNQFFMNMEYDYRKIAQLLYIEDQVLMLRSQRQPQKKQQNSLYMLPQIIRKRISQSKLGQMLQKIIQQ